MIRQSDLSQGTKVRVYRNLSNGKLSVQQKIGGNWKVVSHEDSIRLVGVEFKVSQAGRDRVLIQKRKNVHAFVIGYTTAIAATPNAIVSYNPYKSGNFYNKGNELPVHFAEYVEIDSTGKIAACIL